MIEILITGQRAQRKALLYEFPGKKGRRAYVDAFNAFAHCDEDDTSFRFAVTRYSSKHVFGEVPEDLWGPSGECPTSIEGKPFLGRVREDGPKGFRIQLYEDSCEKQRSLEGEGSVLRFDIQIHFGAAASYGCFLVAGGRWHYRRTFESRMRKWLKLTDVIEVHVLPR